LHFVYCRRFAFRIPMRNLLRSLWLGISIGICAQTADAAEGRQGSGKPALIATADLAGFDALPEDRRKLIEGAIAVARDSPWLRYTPRGADPSQGGFDCSGAMYFVLRKAGLEPPRTAAEQLGWLKSNKRLHEVPPEAVELEHPSLKKLRPGDLLFWGTTGSADDGAKVNITHVAMYLGAEKRDGRPVMINSTDGRSYRGTKANGYGVYDFRLPQAGATVAFMGYGTPLGIAEMPDP
jgi:cell wall-associated NlpC family hydrolase